MFFLSFGRVFKSQTLGVNALGARLFAIVCIRCSETAGSDNNANRRPGQLHFRGGWNLRMLTEI